MIIIAGKDAAGIAMEAINFAKEAKIDIVLIDTAGRMQDNEPLMKALSKVNIWISILIILFPRVIALHYEFPVLVN